jgi:hypothetical protein
MDGVGDGVSSLHEKLAGLSSITSARGIGEYTKLLSSGEKTRYLFVGITIWVDDVIGIGELVNLLSKVNDDRVAEDR